MEILTSEILIDRFESWAHGARRRLSKSRLSPTKSSGPLQTELGHIAEFFFTSDGNARSRFARAFLDLMLTEAELRKFFKSVFGVL